MNQSRKDNKTDPQQFTPGQSFGRYTVVSVDYLDEYQSSGVLLEEKTSGCRIFHVINDDAENLFSYNFGTLPDSSNGVAHILEHTVLCGSQRYPVKDPFVMLYKGSMQTFLNAMTFPDKTIYPASSTVKQDLFNLMRVYGDAVFFPLLRKQHFMQEGHRLEPGKNGEPEIAGIVYNEMKANYSTLDSIEAEWCYRSLFPATPYAHDSGGDPAEIPSLSYEEFLAFHRKWYHPSNCLVFLYGNIPTSEYLSLLDELVFDRFTEEELSRRTEFHIPAPQTWPAPRDFRYSYPVSDGEDEGSSVDLNWLLSSLSGPRDALALEILADILLGSPASPLQKLINESDLGEDMSSSSGPETDLKIPVFTVGMRGTDPERAAEVEALILKGLEDVLAGGLDSDLVEASLRRFEFRSREIKGGGPFGLRLLIRALRGWLHGEHPAASLAFAPYLKEIQDELKRNPGFFLDFIRAHILDNPHRSRVILVPDPRQNAREAELEQELIARSLRDRGGDSPKLRDILAREAQALAEFQQTPDSPEAEATLPFLSVDDIPRQVVKLPCDREEIRIQDQPISLFSHGVYTNGISYMDFGFRIDDLEDELKLFIPLLSHILPQIGGGGMGYEEMVKQWGLRTGGFSMYPEHSLDIQGDHLQYAYLRMKALDGMSASSLELLGDLLGSPSLESSRYIWELFLEYRNDFRSSIIPSGTQYASLRAIKGISPQAHLDDIWRGVIQSRFIEAVYSLEKNGGRDRAAEVLVEMLSHVLSRIFTRRRLLLNLTCDESQMDSLKAQLGEMVSRLPGESGGSSSSAGVLKHFRQTFPELCTFMELPPSAHELIEYSSKVNFTALAIRGSGINERNQVAESVLAHLLRTGYLYEKIRMEGGAYGASASSDSLGGCFSFGSYRDPAIQQSWNSYRHALEFFAGHDLDQHSLDLAKIAMAGNELRPLSPAEKGIVGFKRQKYGISDELRQLRRDWLLDLKPGEIRQAASRLLEAMPGAYRAVLADPEAGKVLGAEIQGLVCIPMG